MHRVRIGLIGLSAVFLLVALAAALLQMTGSESVVNGNSAALAGANSSDGIPTEPLAQLGVVPGNVPAADQKDRHVGAKSGGLPR